MNERQNGLHMLNIERLGLSTNLPKSVIKIRVYFNYNSIIYRKPIINNPKSPYKVIDNLIYYQKDVLDVKIDNFSDDIPEPYYFRSRYILVISSTFLSPCSQGCVFCEQTQVQAEKRRYSIRFDPDDLFEKVLKENKMKDLSQLEQISVITSCTGFEENAIKLLKGYIKAAYQKGFTGKFLFATNEIRSQVALEQMAKMGHTMLAFTVECFSRRKFLMPGTKGEIGLEEIKAILKQAAEIGIPTTYFYIIGLDNLRNMKKGFMYLKEILSYAPTYSIYYHQSRAKNRVIPLRPLKYYLRARKIYNEAHRGLQKFESCQSFRSLWPLENNKLPTLIK